MLNPKYSALAVALTVMLITFLAYASQLFVLELDTRQFYIFNTLVGCIWITYARCMFTDPGSVPDRWQPSWQKLDNFGDGGDGDDVAGGNNDEEGSSSDGDDDAKDAAVREQAKPDKNGRIWSNADCRWCKRCKKWKPARAHHCKTCQRCILLMDHHCPWTFNCVGYRTWPHFIRFLSFVIASCSYLQKFLFVKAYEVYQSRDLPAYLGPSLQQLMLLGILLLVNTITDFAIIVLWIRIISNIIEGYTTIEWWEQERHSSLARRKTVRRQAYPFDIGFYDNLCLFMDGGILVWWCPFLPNRKVEEGAPFGGGLRYEVNGFEKSWLAWPPPDPEKFGIQERRHQQKELENGPWTRGEYDVSDVAAFRRRQREDMKRFKRQDDDDENDSDDEAQRIGRDEDLLDSYLDTGYGSLAMADNYYDERQRQEQIQKKWRNDEGDTLADYGVDEDADMLNDEDKSHHLPHASVHLPADNACFLFLTGEDFATSELESQAIQSIKLCEGLSRARGIVFLRGGDKGATHSTVQTILNYSLRESDSRPFMLLLSKVEDLVPTLEAFLQDFRSQKAAQKDRKSQLQNASMLRNLNLVGKATTHTYISENTVYGLLEAFPSMASYSEACLHSNAKEQLVRVLMIDGYEGDGGREIDSLVEFWHRNHA
ncbi:hypothetical protein H072_5535 [Dactylellina haptotyla CBS 200.50]|uniref:Palmitoyltransferase PFA4 n=1 Tax=Dactylellina haptotyla (strain CBS 200.50) TaxID=1284197 RepID=S8ACB7_DACHA|nr:hypothetical protein H072_5535 [Dactylellina haptotyla CBS 200.50]